MEEWEDWQRRPISGSQMSVAGRNQHHPTCKLVYSSLLVFMPHQACKIKEQNICTEHSHKVKVSHHQTCWDENQQLFSPSPTETTPLAAVFPPVDSIPTYKIWLKEDDKTKLSKSPPEGSPNSRSKVIEEKTWLTVSTAWSFLHLSCIKIHSLSPLKK